MRILTHILEINSTSVGPEPTFTIHLVFASNLKKKYYPNKFYLHVYFIYFFPNIRSTFHRQLIYYWCHCYSSLIYDYILLFTTHLTLISTRYTWTHMNACECNWMVAHNCLCTGGFPWMLNYFLWDNEQQITIIYSIIISNNFISESPLVVDDIATTSLAATDSQNSNDLLVLHSFQEEC